MDVENLAKELILKNMTPEQQMAVLDSVRSSVAQAKEVQKRKIGENVDLVVQALKKIESDIRSRFDDVGNAIEKRVASIQDGRDGTNGKDGRDGKDGKSGRDGAKGDKGDAGRDGRDGVDGIDGISVTSARIDFDGSLVITLSSGIELNVGEVVAPDLAERIKVITNGGGTSQSVLDTLASLQTEIDNLIPSQTGNSGKFLTTNGTATSWASVAGGLSYQGTWNASSNTPTLTSSVGVNGYYYITATAGSTNLNGITDWQIGDWLLFNGSVWQKIDQSEILQTITSTNGSIAVTTTGSNVNLANNGVTSAVAGTGISVSSATGAVTITNSAPDQTVSLTASTGISTSGTYPNFTITNTAPDQTVALTQGGTTTITGTYPNFTISSVDQFQGTVTSVTGTSPVASTGGATPAISLAASYGDTQNPYASKTANFVLAAPNGSAGVPTFRAVVAADIPTLNQNTTGSAATVTTTINSGVVATTQTAGDNSTKVATTAYVNAVTGTNGISGFKNRIINGQMVLDQRNAGASVSVGTATGTYTLDRWRVYHDTAITSNITAQQSTTVPTIGYINSQILTNGTAATAAAGDVNVIQQRVEGLNVADLNFGSSTAATVTLSFWVRSSLTGTFGVTLANSAQNRSYVSTYTISVANTWEQKTVTVAGDQSGTWLTTSGIGLIASWDLGSGTSLNTTAGAWQAGQYFRTSACTSFIGTTGATFYITGVQLEKGSTATSFDYRPYGTELQLCQRYYYPVRGSGQFADVVGTTTDNMFFGTSFPVEMRATPTMTGVLTALIVSNFSTAYTASGGAYSFNGTNTQGVNVRKSGFTTLNTLYRYFVSSTSIVVTANAEL
jgi:hypothetical protein